ncbi:hypothetical protein [Flavobacterium litorale]|uniref:Uncharacterized protein n=1 Tax=Flavobacterium litorale TaxID=2856519 RepID=A0ABX8V771_9FLAO|nr:hypothetical protein [Flavobacterium litorale]QYJ68692.1 hypothetical protein K1I41_02085 [Flavobacterium litorale]
MKLLKPYYEPLLLIIIIITFLLFRKELLGANIYVILGSIVAFYFIPIKIIALIINPDRKQQGLTVLSSLIIAITIGASFIAVNDKNFTGLQTVTYVLAVINVIFMIYAFFKDLERKAFLLHLIIVGFISVMLDFI